RRPARPSWRGPLSRAGPRGERRPSRPNRRYRAERPSLGASRKARRQFGPRRKPPSDLLYRLEKSLRIDFPVVTILDRLSPIRAAAPPEFGVRKGFDRAGHGVRVPALEHHTAATLPDDPGGRPRIGRQHRNPCGHVIEQLVRDGAVPAVVAEMGDHADVRAGDDVERVLVGHITQEHDLPIEQRQCASLLFEESALPPVSYDRGPDMEPSIPAPGNRLDQCPDPTRSLEQAQIDQMQAAGPFTSARMGERGWTRLARRVAYNGDPVAGDPQLGQPFPGFFDDDQDVIDTPDGPLLDSGNGGRVADEPIVWPLPSRIPHRADHGGGVFRHVQYHRNTEPPPRPDRGRGERQVAADDQRGSRPAWGTMDQPHPTGITERRERDRVIDRSAEQPEVAEPVNRGIRQSFEPLSALPVPRHEMHLVASSMERPAHLLDAHVPGIIRIPYLEDLHVRLLSTPIGIRVRASDGSLTTRHPTLAVPTTNARCRSGFAVTESSGSPPRALPVPAEEEYEPPVVRRPEPPVNRDPRHVVAVGAAVHHSAVGGHATPVPCPPDPLPVRLGEVRPAAERVGEERHRLAELLFETPPRSQDLVLGALAINVPQIRVRHRVRADLEPLPAEVGDVVPVQPFRSDPSLRIPQRDRVRADVAGGQEEAGRQRVPLQDRDRDGEVVLVAVVEGDGDGIGKILAALEAVQECGNGERQEMASEEAAV